MKTFKQIYDKAKKQNKSLSEEEFVETYLKEMEAQLPYVD